MSEDLFFKDSTVPQDIAQVIVDAFEAYAAAGFMFALTFLPRGIARVDPRVAGAPLTLRFVILPGIIALWPLFAWRWIAGAHEPIERNPHRVKARGAAWTAPHERSQDVAR